MPILFISSNRSFVEKIKQHGYEAYAINLQNYVPSSQRRTFYVSPANSLCFMDGGYDYALSRVIFPNIEPVVKLAVRQLGIKNLMGRHYLPIGSSLIVHRENASLVVAPTMLWPQDVSNTRNAYYATMAVLYNVLCHSGKSLDEVDIVFTSLCCGYGKMSEENSVQQILEGIRDYRGYCPTIVSTNAVVNEPNLHEQPKYYENSEFFPISPEEIQQV